MKTVIPVYLIVNTLLVIFLMFGCQDSFDLETNQVSIPEEIATKERAKIEDGNPFLELFYVDAKLSISKNAKIEILDCKLRVSPSIDNPNSKVCIHLPSIPSKPYNQVLSYEAGLLPSKLPLGASKVATVKNKIGNITSQVSIRNNGKHLSIQAIFDPVKKMNVQLFREGKLLKSVPTYEGKDIIIDAFPIGTQEVYQFGEKDHPFFVNFFTSGIENFSGFIGEISFTNIDQIRIIPNFEGDIEDYNIYSFSQCSEGSFEGMNLY